MVGEDSGDVLIVLGEPDGLRVEGMLDREVESASNSQDLWIGVSCGVSVTS